MRPSIALFFKTITNGTSYFLSNGRCLQFSKYSGHQLNTACKVFKLRGRWPKNRGSVPGRDWIWTLATFWEPRVVSASMAVIDLDILNSSRSALKPTGSPIHCVPVFSPEGKATGGKAEQTPPSNTEVKISSTIPLLPLRTFMAYTETTLSLPLN